MLRHIRTTLTFTFDDTQTTREAIVDRLDAALDVEFGSDVAPFDVHTRWVCRPEDAPLFGAAARYDAEQ